MTKLTKSNVELKEELFQKCLDYVDNRTQIIQNSIKEIQESLHSETKSSAGDKHETGRAMLQLEREKVGQQLAEIEKIRAQLSRIKTTSTSKIIGLGSVIFSTQANYFIAISGREIEVDGTKFFAISPNTPIGLILMGKTMNDEIVYGSQHFKIVDVI